MECEDQNSTIPGGFFTANPGTGSPYFYSNPFSERPEFLNFYYKFNSVGGDSAWVGIQLLNYDSITPDLSYTERVEIVAYTETYIKESVSEYTEFVLPIEYDTEDFPGFMWIGFRTGDDPQNINYHVGTTLWVDEVTVSGGTLNTSDTNFLETWISLFPNPAKESFQIGTKNRTAIQTLIFYNYVGQEIKRWVNTQDSYSIANIDSGTYLLGIETSKGIVYKRVIKK